MVLVEDSVDEVHLDFAERFVLARVPQHALTAGDAGRSRERTGRRPDRIRQVIRHDPGAIAKCQRVLDGVGQFANVALPRVRFQSFHGILTQGDRLSAVLTAVSIDQMLGEQFDIVLAIAKCRKFDFEGVNSEVKVFAERAFVDHFLEWSICRADNSNIDVEGFIFADAAQFAGLQKSQQFDLSRFVEFAEFVEKQCPAVGHFDQALAVSVRSGERSFAMPEEFAFDQLLGQCSAVHRDKRHVRALALLVDAACGEFFAGSRFAEHQHAGLCWRDLADQFFDSLHRCGIADQVSGAFDRFQSLFERASFVREGSVGSDSLEDRSDVDEFAGLLQKVIGPATDRRNGFVEISVRGVDDDLSVWRDLFKMVDDRPAVDAGHPKVDDGSVKGARVDDLEGFLAAFADGYVVPHARQLDAHDLADHGLIVDKQNAKSIRRVAQANPP